MSKSVTPSEEAEILLAAQERAEVVLHGGQQQPEEVLLAARQKAERVLLAAQRTAEEVLLVAEENVRRGLPDLPEAERLVRAEVAADALRDVRRAATGSGGNTARGKDEDPGRAARRREAEGMTATRDAC
jgi:hypothetical protein